MKILITGARGQIGSDLVTHFQLAGHQVLATDVRDYEGAGWARLDVTHSLSALEVVREFSPDWVVHLAAILSAKGEVNPQKTYDINQGGTVNMLEICRQQDCKFFFASTIAVYGQGVTSPASEETAVLPTTMYGVTKYAGEMLCHYYRQRYGMDIRGVRFPGLISSAEPGGGTSDYAVHMFTQGVRQGRYQAYCRPDTRMPFMYMKDALGAVSRLMAADSNKLNRTIYNIAAFSPRADEFAEAVTKRSPGVDISFATDPHRQGILDSWPDEIDDTYARNDWNWSPQYTLDSMADELMEELKG